MVVMAAGAAPTGHQFFNKVDTIIKWASPRFVNKHGCVLSIIRTAILIACKSDKTSYKTRKNLTSEMWIKHTSAAEKKIERNMSTVFKNNLRAKTLKRLIVAALPGKYACHPTQGNEIFPHVMAISVRIEPTPQNKRPLQPNTVLAYHLPRRTVAD